MKKILFVTSGSIGDAIISTGILGWLMDNHQDARFTIAAGVASAPLFAAFPRLDTLLPIRKLPYNQHWLSLWNAVRRTQWDIVVDLRGSLLSYLIPCRKRYIFQNPDRSLSKAEQLAAMLKLTSLPPARLWTSESDRGKAKQLVPLDSYYVIAPKTNSTAKDWPIERFAELARRLSTPESAFVVLASESQRESVQTLVQALPGQQVIDLSGRTDLPTAIAILARARLFIGNDSGLLHMAAAVGTKCVGLYGPSNDKTYAPRGAHVQIITSYDFKPGEPEKRDNSYMQKISVERVEEAVRQLEAQPLPAPHR